MTEKNSSLIQMHLEEWTRKIREDNKVTEQYTAGNCIVIRGKGRYFNLVNHSKKRIAKKNMARAINKGLPGVQIIKLTECYPSAVVCDDTNNSELDKQEGRLNLDISFTMDPAIQMFPVNMTVTKEGATIQ
jgi:hypothetical protein